MTQLLCKRIIMLNKPHFSLLYMLIKLLESLLQTTTQHYSVCNNLEPLHLTR